MDSLFGQTVEYPSEKPSGPARLRVLVTVKAAPNPSATHGETVCVAGVRLGDVGPTGWIRLYPINFRHLPKDTETFAKYDIVSVDCVPAREPRLESWRPHMSTLRVETHVPPWRKRRELLEPMIDDSMCRIRDGAASDPRSRSLALVRPAEVIGFRLEPHPGWTRDEQAKIDAYVNQLEFDASASRRTRPRWWLPGSGASTRGAAAMLPAARTSSRSSTGGWWPASATCGTDRTRKCARRSGSDSAPNCARRTTTLPSTWVTRPSGCRRSASWVSTTPRRVPREKGTRRGRLSRSRRGR